MTTHAPHIAAQKIYGWFDSADQQEPTYDPPHDAPCPYCGKPVTADDVCTVSLMPVDNNLRNAANTRFYFYRKHRTCDDLALPAAKQSINRKLFDMIKVNHD